ncbi:hypothetical protein Tco_0953398 [Tanacetum coccineum]|uniref:Retrovirus-related Pol polyprotein from transposon TNT 1-94-like beta-barrel domain-containing protein n=1 Tax=Tanacetum coccineum TaxID=301880 RepID=A0ABQ5E2J5_9ASTR
MLVDKTNLMDFRQLGNNFSTSMLHAREIVSFHSHIPTKLHNARDIMPWRATGCPDEWIKDSGCSKHMTGNRNLFFTYKAYNGGNIIFGSNLCGNIIGKGQICDNKCRVTFSEHDSEITKDGKVIGDLDNSTNNVLIPLDSWTSGLLVYRLPLSVEYDVSTSIRYGVSSSLSNTAYSIQLINTAYPLPLDTTYRLSGTETEIIDFHAKKFLPSLGTNPTDCLSLVSDAKTAIQEMAEYSQKWHNKTSRGRSTETSDGLAAMQAQLNNLGREIKKVNEEVYVAQVGCEQCKGPHYTKDCPQKEERKTLEEAYYMREDLEAYQTELKQTRETKSIRFQPPLKLIQTQYTVLDLTNTSYPLDRTGIYGPKFTESCGASRINNAIPRKEKDPRSFTLPCFINDFYFDNALVDLGSSVSVMPLSTYLNLGLGELVHTRLTVELADRTVKYPKGIAKNVLVGIG